MFCITGIVSTAFFIEIMNRFKVMSDKDMRMPKIKKF